MTQMQDYIKLEVANETTKITRDIYIENTGENSSWYTVEDNHISLVSEDVEKVVKIETDILDDCLWESSIEIPKVVTNQDSLFSTLEYQSVSDLSHSSIYSSHKDDEHVNTFSCNVCKKDFDTSINFENHMEKHKKLAEVNYYKCDFCEKKFKLNFGLNRHVQKYHLQNNGSGHKSSCTEKKTDCILNLKLCKLNGVWKSKPNFVYKCNVCFEKFHNENSLTEHVKIHDQDDGQTQCEVCLKVISVSELNDHMQQTHNKNPFACLKCNLRFDKKQNLKRHFHRCTKRSLSKFQNRYKNIAAKNLFVCTVCRIGFSSSFRLKFHILSGCKYHSCKYSRKIFSTKSLWSKHMYENNKYKKCTNIYKTPANKVHDQHIVENSCCLNMKQISRCANVPQRSSNNMNLAVSRESIVQTAPINNLSANTCNMKDNSVCKIVTKNNYFVGADGVKNNEESTVKIATSNSTENDSNSFNIETYDSSLPNNSSEKMILDQTNMMNGSEAFVGALLPHNSSVNNCNAIIKVERNNCVDFTGRNNLDGVAVEEGIESNQQSVMSHNSVINYGQTIKVEQIALNDTERNSSDYVANNGESSFVQPVLGSINMKHEPNVLVNNNVGYMRSPISLVPITKLTNAGNKEISATNNLSTIVFTCKICNNSTNDRHTFALHMSCHTKNNLNECIVCDKQFPSESLWQKHLMFHREKQHSILMLNRNAVQSNNTTDSENTNRQVHCNLILENKSNRVTTRMKRDYQKSNVSGTKNLNKRLRRQFNCSTCSTVFPSKVTLIAHQNVHESRIYPCSYCDRKFSTKGSCTNHEKSHKSNKNKKLLAHVENNSLLEPKEKQYDIEPEYNDVELIQRENRKKKIPLIFCNICQKKFNKRCYWTNHMKLAHGINPNKSNEEQQEQLINSDSVNDNINGETFVETDQNLEEYNNHPSVAAVDKNVNSFSNDTVRDKSCCTICMKQFAHVGALTSHMHVHSTIKPYKCRYCGRQFSMKGAFTIHERTQKCVKDMQRSSHSKNSLAKDSLCTDNYDSELVNSVNNQNSNGTNLFANKRLWFVCDVCDKKFSTPDQLIIHRKLHPDNEPFLCMICNKSYIFRCHWNRHLKFHYSKNKQIKQMKSHQQIDNPNLDVCNVNTNLVQHQSKFKCGFCGKEYNLMSHWKKHLLLNIECRRHCKLGLAELTSPKAKNKIGNECKICRRTYSTEYNCKVHMINVHKALGIAYLEDNTDVKYIDDTIAEDVDNINVKHVDVQTSNNKLKNVSQISTIPRTRRSRQEIKEDKNRHECDICGKNYSNKANLSRHHNQSHLADKELQCEICEMKFKHRYSYQQHMTYKHKSQQYKSASDDSGNVTDVTDIDVSTNKIKSSCILCQMSFTDDNSLQTHIKTIHATMSYKCNDCGQHFDTNVILSEHILRNHCVVGVTSNKNNEYAEDNCLILNESSSSLSSELGLDIDTSSQCKIVPKLETKSYLSNHTELPSDIKPFKCDLCTKAFRFEETFTAHMQKHVSSNVTIMLGESGALS